MFRCHGPRPPPNPEFTLKPKKRKSNQQIEGTPGSPCPPCSELVWRSCVGQHIGTERMVSLKSSYQQYMASSTFITFFARLPLKFYFTTILSWNCFSYFSSVQMVCSDRKKFSCENLCGNLLPCSNHYCTKTCHALVSQFPTSAQNARGEPCEDCQLPCEKVLTLDL